jgi:hypothetical protein
VFVFIHLFSGPSRDGDICYWIQSHSLNAGIKIISFALYLENDSAWDLEDHQVVSTLFRLAFFIDGIAAGPPCCTFSRLRFNRLGYVGAPRPLRLGGKYAWGGQTYQILSRCG